MFAEQWALHGNKAKAYLQAGYADQGPEGNRNEAWKISKKPHVEKHFDRMRELIDARLDMRKETFLRHLTAACTAQLHDVVEFDEEGFMVMRDPETIPLHVRGAIQEIKQETVLCVDGDGKVTIRPNYKVKLFARASAERLLAELKGWRVDKNEKKPQEVKVLFGAHTPPASN